MPDQEPIFNTTPGQTIARELLICYLNAGGTYAAPKWGALGTRVEESSMNYDWGDETKKDILGNTHSTMQKPTVTQSFDPCNLDSADSAISHIWDLGVRKQDNNALAAQDILIVHLYVGNPNASFAERYPSSMVKPTGLGGSGTIDMPIEVTGGGKREVGNASVGTDGTVTFTKDTETAVAAYNFDSE